MPPLPFITEYWPETKSRVEFFPATTPPEIQVTAVKIYVFNGDKLLLANIAKRGWDLPGGHIESGETPGQAVVRELKEETGASVKRFELIGYLKITNERENERNKGYPKVSCVLVYKGYEYMPNTDHSLQFEASECKFIATSQLPHVHHDWNKAKAQVVDFALKY